MPRSKTGAGVTEPVSAVPAPAGPTLAFEPALSPQPDLAATDSAAVVAVERTTAASSGTEFRLVVFDILLADSHAEFGV